MAAKSADTSGSGLASTHSGRGTPSASSGGGSGSVSADAPRTGRAGYMGYVAPEPGKTHAGGSGSSPELASRYAEALRSEGRTAEAEQVEARIAPTTTAERDVVTTVERGRTDVGTARVYTRVGVREGIRTTDGEPQKVLYAVQPSVPTQYDVVTAEPIVKEAEKETTWEKAKAKYAGFEKRVSEKIKTTEKKLPFDVPKFMKKQIKAEALRGFAPFGVAALSVPKGKIRKGIVDVGAASADVGAGLSLPGQYMEFREKPVTTTAPYIAAGLAFKGATFVAKKGVYKAGELAYKIGPKPGTIFAKTTTAIQKWGIRGLGVAYAGTVGAEFISKPPGEVRQKFISRKALEVESLMVGYSLPTTIRKLSPRYKRLPYAAVSEQLPVREIEKRYQIRQPQDIYHVAPARKPYKKQFLESIQRFKRGKAFVTKPPAPFELGKGRKAFREEQLFGSIREFYYTYTVKAPGRALTGEQSRIYADWYSRFGGGGLGFVAEKETIGRIPKSMRGVPAARRSASQFVSKRPGKFFLGTRTETLGAGEVEAVISEKGSKIFLRPGYMGKVVTYVPETGQWFKFYRGTTVGKVLQKETVVGAYKARVGTYLKGLVSKPPKTTLFTPFYTPEDIIGVPTFRRRVTAPTPGRLVPFVPRPSPVVSRRVVRPDVIRRPVPVGFRPRVVSFPERLIPSVPRRPSVGVPRRPPGVAPPRVPPGIVPPFAPPRRPPLISPPGRPPPVREPPFAPPTKPLVVDVDLPKSFFKGVPDVLPGISFKPRYTPSLPGLFGEPVVGELPPPGKIFPGFAIRPVIIKKKKRRRKK